ncbi:hypothetical protein AAVH_28066 [Aphelenchoides avenae]|nr:hypothetical protein AAVH_28066 [Aphelenchus avenae]
MDAVVCYGPKDYRVEKVPIPKPGKNELLMRVEACGICTSDCKCWQGAPYFWDPKHEKPVVSVPVIPGHEFFGYVEELGDGAGEHFGLKVGDRIIPENLLPCRKCRFCNMGQYGMCEPHDIYGFQVDGAFAKYMLVPERSNVYKIPESLSLENCAIIEPLSGAVHCVNRGDIQLSDTVVIAGAGPLGLLMCQVARLKTPKKLIMIDLIDERLELAKKYGADVGINPKKEDPVKAVKNLTNGIGCDVYIEVTGAVEGVKQGLAMISRLGRFVEFSIFGDEVSTDWSPIGRNEINIRGSHAGPYCYPPAIDLLARGLCTSDGLVTHTFTVKEWDKAIEMACSPDSIKVLIKPSD